MTQGVMKTTGPAPRQRQPRYLIVNADDFGLSDSVNRGILEAVEQGIVTSASLMVRQPAAAAAASSARNHPKLSVGLHLDLGEWVCRGGDWVQLYEVVPSQNSAAVREEVQRQLGEFERLIKRPPSHLDSHQHVHRREPVRSILLEAARELSVPVRECAAHIQYCGDFYGQDGEGLPFPEGITVRNLKQTLCSLSEGITELGCHPGYTDDLDSVYAGERIQEVRTLCAPELRSFLAALHVKLCSFHDLPMQNSPSAI